jgi:SpoVK/Ycf46/Vps4 family AAA+-type ATPase
VVSGPSIFVSVSSDDKVVDGAQATAGLGLESPADMPRAFAPRLLVCGVAHNGQTRHFAPAILSELEKFPCYVLDLAALYGSANMQSLEEVVVKTFRDARRTAPSVIYAPHIAEWWSLATPAAIALFQQVCFAESCLACKSFWVDPCCVSDAGGP